jgi:hypothetical protein
MPELAATPKGPASQVCRRARAAAKCWLVHAMADCPATICGLPSGHSRRRPFATMVHCEVAHALTKADGVVQRRSHAKTTGKLRACPSPNRVPAGSRGAPSGRPGTITIASPNCSRKSAGTASSNFVTVGLLAVTTTSPWAQPGWSGHHQTHASTQNMGPMRTRACDSHAPPSGTVDSSCSGSPPMLSVPNVAPGSLGSGPLTKFQGDAALRSNSATCQGSRCRRRSTMRVSSPTRRPST